jgi:hypothetical protein
MKTYAAQIINNEVTQVIVGTAEWATAHLGGQWVDSLVKVGIGWLLIDGMIIPPKPYPSWTLDQDNFNWIPPIPYPDDDKMYYWDEETQKWLEIDESNNP